MERGTRAVSRVRRASMPIRAAALRAKHVRQDVREQATLAMADRIGTVHWAVPAKSGIIRQQVRETLANLALREHMRQTETPLLVRLARLAITAMKAHGIAIRVPIWESGGTKRGNRLPVAVPAPKFPLKTERANRLFAQPREHALASLATKVTKPTAENVKKLSVLRDSI